MKLFTGDGGRRVKAWLSANKLVVVMIWPYVGECERGEEVSVVSLSDDPSVLKNSGSFSSVDDVTSFGNGDGCRWRGSLGLPSVDDFSGKTSSCFELLCLDSGLGLSFFID